MTVYNDVYRLAKESADIRTRVMVAVTKAALDIVVEDGGTANHANRLLWAQNVLSSAGAAKTAAEAMLIAVFTDSTVRTKGETSSDAEVQAAVDAVIDKFATGA